MNSVRDLKYPHPGLLIVLKRKSKVRESSWGILKMPNCHKSVNYNQSERIFTRVSLKKKQNYYCTVDSF